MKKYIGYYTLLLLFLSGCTVARWETLGGVPHAPALCQEGNHQSSEGTCVENSIPCSSADLKLGNALGGIKTWNGASYGLCSVSSCIKGFSLSNGVCSTAPEIPQAALVTFVRPIGTQQILGLDSPGSYNGSSIFCGAEDSGHDTCSVSSDSSGKLMFFFRYLPADAANGTVTLSTDDKAANLSVSAVSVNSDGMPGFEVTVRGIAKPQSVSLGYKAGPKTDVFAIAYDENFLPIMYKNGVASSVSGFISANSIYVDASGHIYIGGRDKNNNGAVSVDGVISVLPNCGGVNQLSALNGHVYVLGFHVDTGVSNVWLDGVEKDLSTLANAHGLATDSGSVYIAGQALNEAGVAIDKDGTVKLLNQNGNFVNAMAVSGGHTYVVGGDLSSSAALWVDGEISLVKGILAATAVDAAKGHIYVGGRNSANHAAISLDGVITELNPNGGGINGISVYVH